MHGEKAKCWPQVAGYQEQNKEIKPINRSEIENYQWFEKNMNIFTSIIT